MQGYWNTVWREWHKTDNESNSAISNSRIHALNKLFTKLVCAVTELSIANVVECLSLPVQCVKFPFRCCIVKNTHVDNGEFICWNFWTGLGSWSNITLDNKSGLENLCIVDHYFCTASHWHDQNKLASFYCSTTVTTHHLSRTRHRSQQVFERDICRHGGPKAVQCRKNRWDCPNLSTTSNNESSVDSRGLLKIHNRA